MTKSRKISQILNAKNAFTGLMDKAAAMLADAFRLPTVRLAIA